MPTKTSVPKSEEKVQNFAPLYESFGVSFITNGDHINLKAEVCPFCTGEKFVVNKNTGQYQCWHANNCGAKGNAFTFIRWVHKTVLDSTTDENYRLLKAKLGLPTQTLKLHELACNGDHWLIPFKSAQGEILNLFRYYPDNKAKRRFLNCLKLCLYGVNGLTPKDNRSDRILFVCEGVPDLMALDHQLRAKNKSRSRYDLLAVPSANVFREEWLPNLTGYKAVRLCFDNDKAGRDGQDRIAKMVHDKKESIKLFSLKWPDDRDKFPDKCDIRDLINGNINVVEFTREHCIRVASGTRRINFVRGDAILKEKSEWLWTGHIPFRTFVSMSGIRGTFKSTLVRDLVARYTSGKPMPLSDRSLPPGNVLYFTSEDTDAVVNDIVSLHGGEVTRLYVHDMMKADEQVNILNCLEEIEAIINAKQARLVVLDALNSFAEGECNSDPRARRTLSGPLMKLATKTGACIIGIRNWGRQETGSASAKALGATSLSDVARSTVNTKELPRRKGDPTRRFFLEIERVSNAKPPDPIPFTVDDMSTCEEDSHLRKICWHPVGSFDDYRSPLTEEETENLQGQFQGQEKVAKNGSKTREPYSAGGKVR